MVHVRNGKRSTARGSLRTGQADYPVVIVHRDIRFTILSPSRLSDTLWLTMCSATTRRCNLHRSVLLKREPTAAQSRTLLIRWIRSLPLDQLM